MSSRGSLYSVPSGTYPPVDPAFLHTVVDDDDDDDDDGGGGDDGCPVQLLKQAIVNTAWDPKKHALAIDKLINQFEIMISAEKLSTLIVKQQLVTEQEACTQHMERNEELKSQLSTFHAQLSNLHASSAAIQFAQSTQPEHLQDSTMSLAEVCARGAMQPFPNLEPSSTCASRRRISQIHAHCAGV